MAKIPSSALAKPHAPIDPQDLPLTGSLSHLELYMPVEELNREIALLPSLIALSELRTFAVQVTGAKFGETRSCPFEDLIRLALCLGYSIKGELWTTLEQREQLRQRSFEWSRSLPATSPDGDPFLTSLHQLAPQILPLPPRHRYIWGAVLARYQGKLDQEAKVIAADAGYVVEGHEAVNAVSDCISTLFDWPTSEIYVGDVTISEERIKFSKFELEIYYPAVDLLHKLGGYCNRIQKDQKATCRLTFDDQTSTATLDNVPYTLSPTQYQFIQAIGIPGKLGTWVPGKEIQNRPTLKGKKLRREIDRLPPILEKLVQALPGPGKGYCLILPPRANPSTR